MMRLWALGLAILLAGCAARAPQQQPASYATQTGDTSDLQTRARIHTELASGYLEIGNYGVALEEAGEALKALPEHVEALNVLGLVYMELRDDAAAESSFQRALRASAGDSDTNNNYGWFLCQRRREAESIKYFLAALRNPLYGTPDKSWVNAGICARQAGDLASATGYFQNALAVRPNQPQALLQLADIAYRRQDYAQAKAYLMRLEGRDITPTAEMLWLALRVERRLGDRDAEASMGFQLRKNFPDSREVRALTAGEYE